MGSVMLEPVAKVHLRWRTDAPADPRLRGRLLEECELIAWPLSQMEALLHDAHQATALEHPWLLPRLELRVPLYDLQRRFRVVISYLEGSRITVVDEGGTSIADVSLG